MHRKGEFSRRHQPLVLQVKVDCDSMPRRGYNDQSSIAFSHIHSSESYRFCISNTPYIEYMYNMQQKEMGII